MTEKTAAEMNEEITQETEPQTEDHTTDASPLPDPKTSMQMIEALLFTMGRSVTCKELSGVLGHDEQTVDRLVRHLSDQYVSEDRGMRIIQLENAWQMCTSPSCYDALVKLTHQPKKHTLTEAMMETLSIIAYKQPVTRSMVEQIRGVNSDYAINRLMEYRLVAEAGRLDAPGRPILFGTTEEFLRTFGVTSRQALPVIDPVRIEEFKTEAEAEAKAETDEAHSDADAKDTMIVPT